MACTHLYCATATVTLETHRLTLIIYAPRSTPAMIWALLLLVAPPPSNRESIAPSSPNKRGISRRPFSDIIRTRARWITRALDYSPFLRSPSSSPEPRGTLVFPTDLPRHVLVFSFIIDPIKRAKNKRKIRHRKDIFRKLYTPNESEALFMDRSVVGGWRRIK